MSKSVLERLALVDRGEELGGKVERAHVLVVDDDPNILKLVEAYITGTKDLAPDGVEVQVHPVASGEEAVTTAKGLKGMPGRLTVALLDIVLPGGADGIDTCLALWQIEPSLQCVLMTGNGVRVEEQIEKRVPAPLLPKCDYMPKPFSRFALTQRLRRSVHAWHANWLEELRRGENIKLVLELGALVDQGGTA
ncbi:MAG TPA: response regulator [Planctomycetota bacterium]|nr:response regulator [Planctomycetota bacterium]